MTTTVIIGGSFAGMTAALEIKRKGKDQHKVILIDKSPLFLFIPSLIWVPFGRREIKDISFKKEDILKKKGFIPEPVYGEQLAINGNLKVPFEGNIKIDFEDFKVKFPDGETVILQKPKYSLENLNYGELKENSVISYRLAQSLNGMALIISITVG